MVRLKEPARKLSLRKRFLALTSNEAVYVRSLDKHLFKLLTGLKQLRLSKKCKAEGISLAKATAEEMLRVMIAPNVVLPSLSSLRDSIDSFTESECWNFFETRKEDLYRLNVNLKFEDKCILENRSVMSGEEVLLRGLYELVSGADQHEHSSSLLIIFMITSCIWLLTTCSGGIIMAICINRVTLSGRYLVVMNNLVLLALLTVIV